MSSTLHPASEPPVRRRALAVYIALALAAAPVGMGLGQSAAAEPVEPVALPTVTAEALATWQTDGVVYAVETVGNVVYAGGNFSKVRPPGATPGQSEQVRKNIAAFDATTGALLPFSHTFAAPSYPVPAGGSYDKTCSPGATAGTYTCDTVYEIRASADKSTIYVGGDFTTVDGAARGNVAAFSTSSSNALLPWRATGITGRVRALAVSADTVYLGGSFTAAGGQPRGRLAALDSATGALRPWAPKVDKQVITMELSADDSRVLLGGQFDTVNGEAIHGLAAVASGGTGESVRWDSRAIPPTSYVTDLSVKDGTVFASANGEGGGVFDGRLAADVATGEIKWQDVCLGATWAIESVGDLVYSGSHAHDCTQTSGGFAESWNVQPPATPRYYRLLAQTADGQEAKHIQHWFPTTNGGIVGKLGPRDLSWTGSQLWVAGEFTTVNGRPQQGLTRFGVKPSAPSAAPVRPDAPTATSTRPGEVHVTVRTTEDLDDPLLTYTVLRGPNTGAMTAVGQVQGRSKPWDRPVLQFRDTGLTPGATVHYQVTATDPTGKVSPRSFATSTRVATAVDTYADAVMSSGASQYWRLDDAPGSTTAQATAGSPGTAASGTTFGRPGALVGDPGRTAARTDGTSGGVVGSNVRNKAPQTFSTEVWFRTSSTGGGKLVGFGDSQLGQSGTYDRHLYMQPNGQLKFGVHPGGVRTITSPRSYNDGQWHSAVTTLGATGMRLYVDGVEVARRTDTTGAQDYDGYWRIGGDTLNGWEGAGRWEFDGDLDEFAVYERALPASEVLAHRAAGRPDSAAPSSPQLQKSTVTGSTVSLTWGESVDDGVVTSYEVHRLGSATGAMSDATRVAAPSTTQVSVPQTPLGSSWYRVVAVDGSGNRSAPSPATEVVVTGRQPYGEAVLRDAPTSYWRLGDRAGSTDVTSVIGADGTAGSGTEFGREGRFADDTAVRTDGSPDGLLVSKQRSTAPDDYTVETWFRTTTGSGGKIVGFGDATSGTSSSYDRHVYMLDDGRLRYGVWLGYAATVDSSVSYNDGQWHHLAASLGPAGLTLSVDGAEVARAADVRNGQPYEGHWRLGGDNHWGGASSSFFAGELDEFAVYDRQLTGDQVAQHARVAGTTAEPEDTTAPSTPSGAATQVSGRDVTVTWDAARDDTAVTGYVLHRGTSADFSVTSATAVGRTTSLRLVDADRPLGTAYYRVVAVDAAGNASAPSAGVAATVADSQAPGTPTGVSGSAASSTVTLTWTAPTDDVGVTGYEVFRSTTDGAAPTTASRVAQVNGPRAVLEGVPAGTSYYRVVAVDAAGNRSDASTSAAVTVAGAPAPTPTTSSSAPVADAWVDSSVPTRNYGPAWALSSDASPVNIAYLKFAVPQAPAGTTLKGAVLRLRTTTSSSAGSVGAHTVKLTDGAAWTETGITYAARPALGATVGTLPAGSTSDTTYEVPLTASALTGALGGDLSLAVSTTSSDGMQVVSREGSGVRPQLVLTFG